MKSKVDSSWDVMKYKYHYELEHQWELKKKFIEAHKTKYPEDRLVCLAQLYCNVHFMGCSYEDNIMELISELSEGIAEKNSKWQKQSFVAASNAVEDRVKNRLNAPRRGPQQQTSTQGGQDASQSKFIKFIQNAVHGEESKAQLWGDSSETNYSADDTGTSGESRKRPGSPFEVDDFYKNKKFKCNFTDSEISDEIRFVTESGPFGRVVLFQNAQVKESPIAIMELTAAAAQMKLTYDFPPRKVQGTDRNNDVVTCKLSLDGMFLSSATGTGKKAAKDQACKNAIEHLKETSFTILVKAAFTGGGSEIDRGLGSSGGGGKAPSNPISDDNIGNKMLKLMGWAGGGLGKNEQGIEEPIAASGTVKREGLGRNDGDFGRKIHTLLREYVQGNDKHDLVFSTDFSKEERKMIHEASRKYNLKSKSYGNESERHLVIFKKARPIEIVEDLLTCGCETAKYKLLPPKSMIERFTQ